MIYDICISGTNRVDIVYHWTKETESDHFCGRVSPGGTVIASGVGSTLTFWDAYSGQVLKEIPAHKNDITRVCFSQDGHMVCTASDDNTLRLWRAPNIPKWNYIRPANEMLSGRRHSISYGESLPGGSGLSYAHTHGT